ncbi:ABC transporter ATP-binding protein [Komagataeibacter intermedius]|uniref:ABC transporter ATP-binding protein n=2 Tax=Komagataeibacter intermedius TaxID=66229 RepID=A0A0N0MHA9_9PROT|nr:ABC transporter ATP-binding protein [Komagataeibacter intermedius]KPH88894.1 ABC transporter ATP-binding protein [Komagataeibacter intermedius AF2]MCF3634961.1 ABC transporter ATP-binding protein [Komagataeibacter intermedius]GAN86305.1 ABC transporter lipoprotein releasing system LolD [Komagataeibacter intermedius TF2]GBQ66489.1 lipoprotein releasing system ATP-binding protein LolD [Komagataeibacter intermedius NRIC 0521]
MNDALNAGAAPLRMDGVSRRYVSGEETLDVLRGADLTLHPGEIVALVAPSGTGKSTLLHLAGLLEHPDAGCVMVAGQDTGALTDARRTEIRRDRIGFVYQFHHLLAEFTARENVMLPQMIAGVARRAARTRADELLGLFGLGHRLDHLPGKLSGGEKQRVAIARALANRPHVLLADEPTGNLDVHTSDAVFDALLETVRAHGVAALIATHNMDLARRMDRIVTLRDGLVVPVAPAT